MERLIQQEVAALHFRLQDKKEVTVTYTNWRGEKAVRRIIPEELYFGSTEWHPDEQWLLRAYDVEKEVYRDFSLREMTGCFERE